MANKYETRLQEEMEKFDKNKLLPNIMLLGETGCGKSSLINRFFGQEIAYVSDVNRGTEDFETYRCNKVNLIDSRGYEFSDGKTDSLEKYTKAIKNKLATSGKDDPYSKIHIVWYCVSVAGYKVQNYDIQTIRVLLDEPELKNRVCVVLTKCDQDDENGSAATAIKADIQNNLKKVLACFEVSTLPDCPLEIEKLKDWSIAQLGNKDLEEAFIQSQIIDLKAKRNQAGTKIAFYSAAAAVIGANPIPLGVTDAVMLTSLQLIMATHIINSYGLGSMENIAKSVIGATIIPTLGRSLAGGLIKLIPGAGQVIAGGVASAITAALGCAISQICFTCCEEIAKGAKVDFETAFSAENIGNAFKAFRKLSKNDKNDFVIYNGLDEAEAEKFGKKLQKESEGKTY